MYRIQVYVVGQKDPSFSVDAHEMPKDIVLGDPQSFQYKDKDGQVGMVLLNHSQVAAVVIAPLG